MSGSIRMVMLEIPKSLSVHNIAKIKEKINQFSGDSLDIIRRTIEDKVYEEIDSPDLSERLEEEHLFSLDEDSRAALISRFITKDFLIKAIDEVITPYLAGEEASVGERTIYKKIGAATYAISFKEEYSYRNEATDYSLVRALIASDVLSGKL